ncbi:UNVERIFIED_CONTAM: hypothetical protein Sangu_1553900 [Sesamum angustifolium]|uniref:RNase H type-1 domain-containing protein n=1 Tax=Sesamum angustifolium TaxID=2727405 RepID=A0AAW2MQR9_9LAMI
MRRSRSAERYRGRNKEERKMDNAPIKGIIHMIAGGPTGGDSGKSLKSVNRNGTSEKDDDGEVFGSRHPFCIQRDLGRLGLNLQMGSPRTIKDVQKLTNKVASLARFISRSADRNLPFFRTLRKVKDFQWTKECEQALRDLKQYLMTPPLLANPKASEALYLYLAVSDEAVSAALVREEAGCQSPIYYVNKMLQVVADFVVELAGETEQQGKEGWMLHVDGSSTSSAGGAGILLQGPGGVEIEVVVRFDVPTTNNKAEYEALVIGLQMALEVNVKQLDIYADPIAAKRLRFRVNRFTMLKRELYKRTAEGLLLKCLGPEKANYVLREIHEAVGNPQASGQTEVSNRILLQHLKTRLDGAKGSWVEELPGVLWAYRTTPRTATGETPFCLVYGSKTIIPAEIGEETARIAQYSSEENEQQSEAKELPSGDLVLKRVEVSKHVGKLDPNWEGLYKVTEVKMKGAYRLQDLEGKELPRPWNAHNLRKFYA